MSSKKIAIVFKRKKENKKKEIVIVPMNYVFGEEIEKDGCKTFVTTDDAHIPTINDIKYLNEEFVYGFTIEYDQLLNSLNGDETYVQTYLEILLEALNEFNYFQKIDKKTNELIGYTYKKLVREIHQIDLDALHAAIASKELGSAQTHQQKEQELNDAFAEIKALPECSVNVKKLYKNVTDTVIGQDEAIRQIVSAIAKNQVITNPRLKSSILVAGSTGVGKTEIFRVISRYLGLPITIQDATQYTVAGYVGRSVEEMLADLLVAANMDLPSAEKGILVIDEIDKKAGGQGDEKVATSGVLESLLKIMEGGVISVPINKQKVNFDTSRMTFAALGAFSGLEKIAKPKPPVGFGSMEEKIDKFSTESFDKFGILPEFVGRCNTRVILNDLDKDTQLRILLESDNSIIKLQQELFSYYGVNLWFHPEALNVIAEESVKLKTGARGLTTVTNYALSDVTFKIQEDAIYSEAKIFPETIYDNTKYELIRKR